MSILAEPRPNPTPFDGFFGHAEDPVLVMTPAGSLVYANEKAHAVIPDLFGNALKVPGGGFSEKLRADLERVTRSAGTLPLRLDHGGGTALFKAWRIEAGPSDNPRVLVMMMGDASAELRAKFLNLRSEVAAIENTRLKDRIQAKMLVEETAHLRRMANTDRLTGLATAEVLEQEVNVALSKPACRGGLIFIDLDRFKSVNDEHGHCAGDAVLRAIGARIRQLLRPQDIAGRIGGDELCYWCRDCSPEDVLEIADQLRNVIQDTVIWTKNYSHRVALTVGASVGLAFAPCDGHQFEHLKTVADRRMYNEKHLRRLVPPVRSVAQG